MSMKRNSHACKLTALALVCALTFSLGGCGASPEEDYDKACALYYDEGDYDAAYRLLKKYENSDNAGILTLLGDCYRYGSGTEQDSAKAVELYRKAAGAGNMWAMLNLGWCTYDGDGVDADPEAALSYFEQAQAMGCEDVYTGLAVCCEALGDYEKAVEYYNTGIEKDNDRTPDALCGLANLYDNGLGVEQDTAKAVSLYETAAEKGSTWGMVALGWHYRILGGSNNLKKAAAWFKQAADIDNADGYYGYGLCSLDLKNYDAALEYLTLAVDAGVGDAVMDLASMYENGLGVERDAEKAQQLYEIAAQSGNGGSLLSLGWQRYSEGDYDGAIELFLQAEALGIDDACFALGLAYGDVDDYENSFSYLSRAAELGGNDAVEAKVALAALYDNGQGVAQDRDKAQQLYTEAAQSGDGGALLSLGWRYFENGNMRRAVECFRTSVERGISNAYFGLGMSLKSLGSYAEAAENLEKTAELGNADSVGAQLELAELYANGYGVAQDYGKALELYTKAAEAGDGDAMNGLGDLYYYGRGTDTDYDKSFLWYSRSADTGNIYGMYNCAFQYASGLGTAQDFDKAKALYQKSLDGGNTEAAPALQATEEMAGYSALAAKGDTSAMLKLGRFLQYGTYIAQDTDKAMSLYQSALDAGDAAAMRFIGTIHSDRRDYASALEWYQKGADAGDPDAMIALGSAYRFGDGVKRDVLSGIEWYKKAAELGSTDAPVRLGRMYEYGNGVTRDYNEALKWYEQAAAAGSAEGAELAGTMYYLGRCGAVDYVKAAEYYEQAASGDDTYAMNYLGWMYANGLGVEQSFARAVEFYEKAVELRGNTDGSRLEITKQFLADQKAAEEGDDAAAISLALAYYDGNAVAEDFAKAKELLRPLAENGSVDAMVAIGKVERGKYVGWTSHTECDYGAAMEWFKKAAELGSTEAMCEIASMYNLNEGVARNPDTILYWYTLAADAGDADAAGDVAGLYKSSYHDYEKAFEWYTKAYEMGSSNVAYSIAYLYYEGEGVEQDYAKALEWFQKAAVTHVYARFRLAEMYYKGIGVEQNYSLAKEWYERAMYAGNDYATADSLTRLGQMYYNGFGVRQDKVKALEYYEEAAGYGATTAIRAAGDMYYLGDGVEKDAAKAARYYDLPVDIFLPALD